MDILILNSHDVGTYAYSISKEYGFSEVKVNEEIRHHGELIFNEKYLE